MPRVAGTSFSVSLSLYHTHTTHPPFHRHVPLVSVSRMGAGPLISLPLGCVPLFFAPSRSLHFRVSAADAVIVRCSSRCIVVRNNDFIKIHARENADDTTGRERKMVKERGRGIARRMGTRASWKTRGMIFLRGRVFAPVCGWKCFFEGEESSRFDTSRFCRARSFLVAFDNVNSFPFSLSIAAH